MADPHALPGGPVALRARLEELGLTAYALAKRLDVNLSVVSRWLSGERLPSTPSALALQAEIGLPVDVWARPLAAAEAAEAPPEFEPAALVAPASQPQEQKRCGAMGQTPPGTYLLWRCGLEEGHVGFHSDGEHLWADAPADPLPAVHEEPSAPQLSTLTKRYRWIFENRGTNASRLAHEAGLSRSHIRDQISLEEAGKKVSPTVDTVERIARAADVSFLWLAVGHGEPGHFSNPGVFAPEARPAGLGTGRDVLVDASAPLPEGTGEGQGPLWDKLRHLSGEIRWGVSADTAKALLPRVEALAEQVRAALSLEWQRGHGCGVVEERERIRRVLERRLDDLRDQQTRWSISKADLVQRAHEAAEEEAEVRARAEAVEGALSAIGGGS